MWRYTKLYALFVIQRIKILLEYRLDFVIGAGSTVLLQSTALLALWAVMQQIPELHGWTLDQILLMLGLLTLARSINHMFADNLWTVGPRYVQAGGFDRFLVRPIEPLFHLLADRFCQEGIGTFLLGLALVIKSSLALHLQWTLLKLAYVMVSVLSGGLIFIALNLIAATTAFWVQDPIPIVYAVWSTHEFAKYPLTIYGRRIGLLMTWVIPFGFASYYPASTLLDRDVGRLAWAGPLVALALAFAAYQFWRFGLRRYTGTGS